MMSRRGIQCAARALLRADNAIDGQASRTFDSLLNRERKAYEFAASCAIRAYVKAVLREDPAADIGEPFRAEG